MSDAGLYSLVAVILAGCIAFFTSVYTIRKQQPGMDADSENDRASALERTAALANLADFGRVYRIDGD